MKVGQVFDLNLSINLLKDVCNLKRGHQLRGTLRSEKSKFVGVAFLAWFGLITRTWQNES